MTLAAGISVHRQSHSKCSKVGFQANVLTPARTPERSEWLHEPVDRRLSPITGAQRAFVTTPRAPGPCKGSCNRFLDDAPKDQFVEVHLGTTLLWVI